MTTIIGVRFRNMGKVYYFTLSKGSHTARKREWGCHLKAVYLFTIFKLLIMYNH